VADVGAFARVRFASRSCIALLVAFWALSASADSSTVVTFGLVPDGYSPSAGHDPREAILEGEIRLYRLGAYRPEMYVASGLPAAVPEGEWVWIAEGPGYVSRETGILIVRGAGPQRRLLIPVIPACELVLAGSWKGVDRLDVTSIDLGTTYPLDPSRRRSMQVPAGRVFGYTVTRQQLLAIGPPRMCIAGETLSMAPPPRPERDRQDIMVHVGLGAEPGALAAALRLEVFGGDDQAPVAPGFVVPVRDRVTAVFADLPVRPVTLVARQPDLASARLEVVPRPGEAHEATLTLTARKSLVVPVDFQPQRAHGGASLHLLRCGDNAGPFLHLGAGCSEAAPRQELIQGLVNYRFEDLDIGQYLVEARIGDEVISGLENALAPFIEPGDSDLVLPRQNLHEEYIYGHLLLDGEAVPGEVRLQRIGGGPPLRTFGTDDHLTYHIFYFGVRDWSDLNLGRRRATRAGLPAFLVLRACDRAEHCHVFHHRSSFRGSGRFDIILDDMSNLIVQVRDAATHEGIAKAQLVYSSGGRITPTVLFEDGEISERGPGEGGSAEGFMSWTSEAGTARLLGVAAGDVWLHVSASEYRDWAGTVAVLAGTSQEHEVLLEPSYPHGGSRAVFPDGRPAVSAAFLTFADDGRPDVACIVFADTRGEADIPPACLEDQARPWVVLHGDALLAVTDAAALVRAAAIALVPSATSLPLRLRLVRSDGTPAAGLPVALRFPRFTLTADHLVAGSRSGLDARALTDENGAIAFPFVSAEGPLPWLVVGGTALPLVMTSEQTVIEVHLP